MVILRTATATTPTIKLTTMTAIATKRYTINGELNIDNITATYRVI